jgi:hypothetical protein
MLENSLNMTSKKPFSSNLVDALNLIDKNEYKLAIETLISNFESLIRENNIYYKIAPQFLKIFENNNPFEITSKKKLLKVHRLTISKYMNSIVDKALKFFSNGCINKTDLHFIMGLLHFVNARIVEGKYRRFFVHSLIHAISDFEISRSSKNSYEMLVVSYLKLCGVCLLKNKFNEFLKSVNKFRNVLECEVEYNQLDPSFKDYIEKKLYGIHLTLVCIKRIVNIEYEAKPQNPNIYVIKQLENLRGLKNWIHSIRLNHYCESHKKVPDKINQEIYLNLLNLLKVKCADIYEDIFAKDRENKRDYSREGLINIARYDVDTIFFPDSYLGKKILALIDPASPRVQTQPNNSNKSSYNEIQNSLGQPQDQPPKKLDASSGGEHDQESSQVSDAYKSTKIFLKTNIPKPDELTDDVFKRSDESYFSI